MISRMLAYSLSFILGYGYIDFIIGEVLSGSV